MERRKKDPILLRRNSMILDEPTTLRVRRFIARVGVRAAQDRLGISVHTLYQVRDFGRVTKDTADRVLASLSREELAMGDRL